MQHDEKDPRVIEGLRHHPEFAGATSNFRVVELVWQVSEFLVRSFELQCSPFTLVDHLRRVREMNEERQRVPGMFINLDLSKSMSSNAARPSDPCGHPSSNTI